MYDLSLPGCLIQTDQSIQEEAAVDKSIKVKGSHNQSIMKYHQTSRTIFMLNYVLVKDTESQREKKLEKK